MGDETNEPMMDQSPADNGASDAAAPATSDNSASAEGGGQDVGTVEDGMDDAAGTPVDVQAGLNDTADVGDGTLATQPDTNEADTVEGRGRSPAGSSGKHDGTGYTVYDGSVRVGGTLAWRNNNPGNIRPGTFPTNHGAIGSAFGFAVFPDEQTGNNALNALLRTQTYQKLTVRGAIFLYAPPNDNNDTENYVNFIRRVTGLDPNTAMSSLTSDQLDSVAGAIRTMEGWRAGQEFTCSTQNLPPWVSNLLGC